MLAETVCSHILVNMLFISFLFIAGILTTANYMSEYNQDRFVLDVIAQEVAAPHRQAKAQVYVSTPQLDTQNLSGS